MILKNYEDLHQIRSDRRQKLAVAFGVFDVLHVGHVRFLERVRQTHEGILAVGLLDDELTAYQKPGRPINNENNRAELLNAFKAPDCVFIINKSGGYNMFCEKYRIGEKERCLWEKCLYCLSVLKPDDFYYSDDFKITPEIQQFFADYDINTHVIGYTDGVSTTDILKRLKAIEVAK